MPDCTSMIRKLFLLSLFFEGLFLISPISAQKTNQLNWSVAAELPAKNNSEKHSGLAGAFIGVHHNVLLISGGANFPNAMPWDGGKKVYYEDIYVLEEKAQSKFSWINTGKFKLSQRIAYGASASTPNGIICVGGENENGILESVFLLQWDESLKKITTKNLPDLPLPLTNACAAVNGSIVYVAGGETSAGVSDQFFSFDLIKTDAGWKKMPVIPKPVSHAVMIIQSDGGHSSVYLIGGRKKNANGISDIYSSVYAFDLKKNEWEEKKSLPYALSAGTSIASGTNTILLFGGDKGDTFLQTEMLIAATNAERDELKKQELTRQKNKLQKSHPGFATEVLAYNTIKDEWKLVGKIPIVTPVTTTAVKWQNRVFIPSGEIKAGVRTPQILMGMYNDKIK